MQILLRVWLSLQAAASGGQIYSNLDHFSASFQWISFLLHWKEGIEHLEHHIQISACGQTYLKPYNIVLLPDLHFSVGIVAGCFGTSVGQLVFKCWGSALHFGDPLEEIYILYILDLIYIFLNTSEYLNIFADMHTQISDLLHVLHVLLKTPRGF